MARNKNSFNIELKKLPKVLDVFGKKVKVLIKSLHPNYAAQYDVVNHEIFINDVEESYMEQGPLHSLLHEAGHALFYRVSINQAVSFETHEYIVNNYATMLLENFDITPKKGTKN